MAQNKLIIFSMVFFALIIFQTQGRHLKSYESNDQNLLKNHEDLNMNNMHGNSLATTNAATPINGSPPPPMPPSAVGGAPPPSHGVGDFRPTTPGHSPGVGHSIHN